jgi:hypothetical protein
MGKDGAALPGQADRPGADGNGWAAVFGSSALDRPHEQPLARSPPVFGKWNTVFKRFREWVKADVFQKIFDAVSDEPDMECAMIDGTIVKVHRHGQGAKGGLKARP